MITLITGLPGNGKTLYALSLINALSISDNRPVFYSGIKDLTLPWSEIESKKWMDCPPNSLIVIDECQFDFGIRTMSKEVPEHVARLATHRHGGVDIYLITQHPMLLDPFIRRLIGKHLHVVRTFGAQRSTIHEWGSVKDNCDKSSGRSDSIKHFWKFDKKAFDFYKSAELHTVKRSIPFKVWAFLLVPVLLVAAVVFMINFMDKQKQPKTVSGQTVPGQTVPGQTVPVQSAPVRQGVGKASYKDAMEDAKQFVFENTPRVVGVPSSAPKYDDLTKPTSVPVPAGCISSKTSCSCFTQQATPIHMSDSMCRQIVLNGFFQDYDSVVRSRNEQNTSKQKTL